MVISWLLVFLCCQIQVEAVPIDWEMPPLQKITFSPESQKLLDLALIFNATTLSGAPVLDASVIPTDAAVTTAVATAATTVAVITTTNTTVAINEFGPEEAEEVSIDKFFYDGISAADASAEIVTETQISVLAVSQLDAPKSAIVFTSPVFDLVDSHMRFYSVLLSSPPVILIVIFMMAGRFLIFYF